MKNEINHFVKQIYSNWVFRLSNLMNTFKILLFKYSVLVLSSIYYKSLTVLLNNWNRISLKAFIDHDSQGSNLVVFLLYSVANLNGGYFLTSEISKSICRVPSTLLYWLKMVYCCHSSLLNSVSSFIFNSKWNYLLTVFIGQLFKSSICICSEPANAYLEKFNYTSNHNNVYSLRFRLAFLCNLLLTYPSIFSSLL